MLSLLQIEFKKIKNYSTFWVITGLYLFFVPVILFGVGQFEIEEISFKLDSIYEFPLIWNAVTYLASWFNLLLIGLLVIILISNEFKFKTFRQHVIDGQSRLDFFIAKMLLILTFALGSTIYLFFIGLLFGLGFTDSVGDASIFEGIKYLPIYFIQTVGYMSVALLIGVLIRSSALAIILFILSQIIESIIRIVPRLIFKESSIDKYFPMEIISNLTPYPFPDDALIQQAKNAILPEEIPLNTSIAATLIYIIIFCTLTYWSLLKKDIK